MQRATFLVGQVVTFVVGDEIDDCPVGQCRRLIKDEATFLDASSQRANAATVRLQWLPGKHSGRLGQGSISLSQGTMRFKLAATYGHHLVSPMPAVARAQYQLGFFAGGYTGTAGTKPFRFGISTFGRVFSSMTSFSLMMPFQKYRTATRA